ncbi:MAG: hypothetical protein MI861_24720, partial [Pirellulales bacterium]|nr:hypothetical protein [Pirellulales bacterium]
KPSFAVRHGCPGYCAAHKSATYAVHSGLVKPISGPNLSTRSGPMAAIPQHGVLILDVRAAI